MAEQPSEQQAEEAPATEQGSGMVEESTEAAAEQALQSATSAAERIKSHALGDAARVAATQGRTLQLEDLTSEEVSEELAAGIGLLDDIDLTVRIELGRTLMYVEDVLRLNANSVVELDKAAGDPVDIFVNDRHVARGEVLVLNENFCVRISEIIRQVDAFDDIHTNGSLPPQAGAEAGKESNGE